MDRKPRQRVYSGAVRGEVVIQGDLSAKGDINIGIYISDSGPSTESR